MSKVTCSPVCISLQNVPAGFGLVESKRLIMKHLNDENIDISPYYYKNADGEVVKSTIIIQFKDTFCKCFRLFISNQPKIFQIVPKSLRFT